LSNYPRSSKKQVRIIYFDELDQDVNTTKFQDEATAVLKGYYNIKQKKKLKIDPTAINEISSFSVQGKHGHYF